MTDPIPKNLQDRVLSGEFIEKDLPKMGILSIVSFEGRDPDLQGMLGRIMNDYFLHTSYRYVAIIQSQPGLDEFVKRSWKALSKSDKTNVIVRYGERPCVALTRRAWKLLNGFSGKSRDGDVLADFVERAKAERKISVLEIFGEAGREGVK